MSSDIHVDVVCSSNMNRSMEAQAFLLEKGFKVNSFGTVDKLWLPGTSVNRSDYYEFGVPYKDIYNDLLKKDQDFHTHSELLHILDKNRRIKQCPENFQISTARFDIIITCEERVYDEVIEWFGSDRSVHNQPVHIVDIDIKDNQEEATMGAFLIAN